MSIIASPALSSRILGVLRIVSAYLLLTHASAKFFAIPHVAYFDNLQLFSLIGLFTRPVAFVLSGLLAFAYFIGHASKGFFFAPMMNGGESAVLFCFVFLYFAVAGAGSFSIDNRRNAA